MVQSVASQPGPCLVALQAIADEFGYVPVEAVAVVAEVLNLSRAEVHGVLTFYHDLRTEPAPMATVRLCVAEACQASGSREVVTRAQEALGVQLGGRSNDGIELEAVYCLGNCALGPAALVDGRLVGRLDVVAVDSLIDGLRAEVATR